MTAFGWQGSQGGRIDHNRIWFNESYDEGGGVMVAGELPSDPTQLSTGTGPVSIDHNMISANIANDDGGGIRLLQVSGRLMSTNNPSRVSIVNNTVVNNVSAHEGGGIALDDAPFVNLVHNTVARNLTTATAVTSDGLPAPAGLSTAANSDQLAARLRQVFGNTATVVTTPFSKPTVLNDVFWDNRAGTVQRRPGHRHRRPPDGSTAASRTGTWASGTCRQRRTPRSARCSRRSARSSWTRLGHRHRHPRR